MAAVLLFLALIPVILGVMFGWVVGILSTVALLAFLTFITD